MTCQNAFLFSSNEKTWLDQRQTKHVQQEQVFNYQVFRQTHIIHEEINSNQSGPVAHCKSILNQENVTFI